MAGATMELHLVNGTQCLDGSPAGFYIHHPSASRSKWLFKFQGGGWCYDPELCYRRIVEVPSKASSKGWQATKQRSEHFLYSTNATLNPALHDASVVELPYCDGFSWSGGQSIDEPPTWVNGTAVHMGRGLANLRAMLGHLVKHEGLGAADDLVLSGGSAGALSSMLHVDRLADRLPSARVRAVPGSGWFPEADVPSYPTPPRTYALRMRGAARAHRAVPPRRCAAARPRDAWRCFFAEHLVPSVASPIFVLNSLYDAWQWRNEYGLPCPAHHGPGHPFCATPEGWLTTNCECRNSTTAAVATIAPATARALNHFAARMAATVRGALDPSKDGGFLDSCMGHDREGDGAIDIGGANVRDAVMAWLMGGARTGAPAAPRRTAGSRRASAPVADGADAHLHVDCLWSAEPPYTCNAACRHWP